MSEVKKLIAEAREAANEQGWVNHSDTLLGRLADALEALDSAPPVARPLPDRETVMTADAAMSFDVIPRGTIVRSAAGTIACRYDERHGTVFGDERRFLWHELALPLTILWTPTSAEGDDAVLAAIEKGVQSNG